MADAKKNTWDKLSDLLFGKAALESAAGTKKTPPASAPSAADYDAARKRAQSYADEVKARDAAAKKAADELAIPRAKKVR